MSRPQKSKRRDDYVKAMQDFRRSNSTAPIPSGAKYKRPKAGARKRDW